MSEDEKSSDNQTEVQTVVTYSEAVVPVGNFGEKTIGMVSGFMLLVNNVTGPGLVTMPSVNSSAGWLLTTALLLICWVASGLACTMLLEAIKKMPGNSKFEQRIEFTTLAKHHFTGGYRWLYVATLCIFLASFLTTLIASVIESAQTMDSALIEIFGKSCALQFHNSSDADVGVGSFGFVCVGDESRSGSSTEDSPFGDSAYVISIGYILVLTVALPLGYWNLDDNIFVQNFAFCGLCFIVLEWTIQAFVKGLHFSDSPPTNLPIVGSDLSSVFGTVLFNYAFVTTVPSWCNEKKVGVSINKSIWGSSFLGTVMFLCCGLFSAAAWDFGDKTDLLAKLTDKSTSGVAEFTKVLAYAFPIIALVTSIPIFSIIVRYNLLENNICRPFWANFWGALFPWIAAVALYAGNALNDTVNWAGLLTIVPLNFILPAWFYIKSLEYDHEEPEEEGLLNTANAHQQYSLNAQDDGPGMSRPATHDDEETPIVEYAVGDEVDAWIPGHKWVPCTITGPLVDGYYTIESDDPNVEERDNVPPTNIRMRQENFSPREVQEDEDDVRPEDRLRRGVEQRRMNELQARLDRYEQKMEDLQNEISVLVTQFPGDMEHIRMKELSKKELQKLQRTVDGIIEEMEKARAGDMTLTPAMRDELFTALPASISNKNKIRIAWGLIVGTTIINIIALVYAFI
eukprot:TRINITY_DN9809_c0_g2_i1.p1 TRINITY_DN9809_c0_g2~~TRINITY_DN9809_c0_g2_i1.p1  ORF type:complete len:694 (+),score=177.40 TRINITY_DN9809_c0_g2_i1:34-2082(+)